jgi:hypothetical protein
MHRTNSLVQRTRPKEELAQETRHIVGSSSLALSASQPLMPQPAAHAPPLIAISSSAHLQSVCELLTNVQSFEMRTEGSAAERCGPTTTRNFK